MCARTGVRQNEAKQIAIKGEAFASVVVCWANSYWQVLFFVSCLNGARSKLRRTIYVSYMYSFRGVRGGVGACIRACVAGGSGGSGL